MSETLTTKEALGRLHDHIDGMNAILYSAIHDAPPLAGLRRAVETLDDRIEELEKAQTIPDDEHEAWKYLGRFLLGLSLWLEAHGYEEDIQVGPWRIVRDSRGTSV